MNENNIRAYARKLGIKLSRIVLPNGWLQGGCPFAQWTHKNGTDRNFSFGVRVNKSGKSGYKCFACGQSGSMAKLAYSLGNFRDEDYTKLGQEIELTEVTDVDLIDLPEWDEDDEEKKEDKSWESSGYESSFPYAIGHPYLAERGIGWKTTKKLGIRLDSYRQRILFPVYDDRARFRGFSGRYCGTRKITKRNPRIKDYYGLPKRELFLGEHYIPNRSRTGYGDSFNIVVVEGLFDYARLHQFRGFTKQKFWPVSILGTEITGEKFDKLLAFDAPIIWMVDNDEAGDKVLYGKIDPKTKTHDFSTGALNRLYGMVPQLLVKYPERLNKNGKPVKDPGELYDSEIKQMIDSAELFIK